MTFVYIMYRRKYAFAPTSQTSKECSEAYKRGRIKKQTHNNFGF